MNTHTRWLDEPRNIRLLWRGFIVALALSVLAEFFIHQHPQFEIEGWFALNAAYGFVTCVLMILGAKLLGLLLKRPDTFYAQDEVDD